MEVELHNQELSVSYNPKINVALFHHCWLRDSYVGNIIIGDASINGMAITFLCVMPSSKSISSSSTSHSEWVIGVSIDGANRSEIRYNTLIKFENIALYIWPITDTFLFCS